MVSQTPFLGWTLGGCITRREGTIINGQIAAGPSATRSFTARQTDFIMDTTGSGGSTVERIATGRRRVAKTCFRSSLSSFYIVLSVDCFLEYLTTILGQSVLLTGLDTAGISLDDETAEIITIAAATARIPAASISNSESIDYYLWQSNSTSVAGLASAASPVQGC